MKTLACITLIFSLSICVSEAQPSPVKVKQVVAIVAQLPPLIKVQQYRTLVRDAVASAKDPATTTEARDSLDFIQTSIPQLTRLIEPGASVFDYPGLLAIGDVSFTYVGENKPSPFSPEDTTKSTPIKGYLISYVTEGIGFRIEIDERGSIVQVKEAVRPK